MNVDADLAVLLVAGIGAVGSMFVVKNDMKWIRERMIDVSRSVTRAHDRIDDLQGIPRRMRVSDPARETETA